MPRTNEKQILNITNPGAAKEPDWMDKLNNIVGNVKSTISEIKPMIELARGQAQTQNQTPTQNGLQQFLALLKVSGYADKPIGELITMIAPYTINQLEELAKKQLPGGR